jgi:mono/diheme cytochrome c family protein
MNEASGPSHTLALGRIHKEELAFVADEDRSALLTFALARPAMRFVSRTTLPGKPSSVRLLPTGELAVTLRDRSQVAFLEPGREGLRVVAITDVCAEPLSTTDFDDELFVVCGWGHALDTLSTRTHRQVSRVDLPREPRAVVLDPYGRYFYVSHAVGSRLTVVDRGNGHVLETSLSVAGLPPLPPSPRALSLGMAGLLGDGFFGDVIGELAASPRVPEERLRPRFAMQGFSLAYLSRPEGGRLFLPEVLMAPREAPTRTADVVVSPPTRSTGYGGEAVSWFGGPTVPPRGSAAPYLATLDVRGAVVHRNASPSAAGESRCLLPRAAASTREGRVFVACLGSNEVLEYNGLAGEPDEHLVARSVVAQGPTGVAYADDDLYVWSSYERVLTRIDNKLGSGGDGFDVVSDTAERPPTPFEVGRRLFHRTDSRRISGDGRACASCHPDGRDDGLVWSSPDGPRQTPMLAGRLADTAPFGWTGGAATVREHLKQTFARLGGSGLDDASLYALLTYVAQMAPPPVVAIGAPGDPGIAAGKRIFESYDTGCSSCHDPSRAFSDGESHEVGSASTGDLVKAFETPSLRGVGGTAPYFHDGRYGSLEELLRKSQAMAETKQLSEEELAHLAAYLRTL